MEKTLIFENVKMKFKRNAFTLIETIVSITILSIIMVSVLFIFVSSTDMSYKIDINRAMQENIKNIDEQLSEDIRKNGVNICNGWGTDCYDFSFSPSDKYIESDTLYIWENTYYLAKEITGGSFVKSWSISDCNKLEDQCILVKNGNMPLSNSQVHLSELRFFISQEDIPKVTIGFVIKPSIKKWVKINLIKENSIIFETTISQRIIKSK